MSLFFSLNLKAVKEAAGEQKMSVEITQETKVSDLTGSGYTIISPEQKERQKRYFERSNNSNERFVMVKEQFSNVKDKLTLEQNGLLMFMVSFVKFNSDGALFHNKKRIGVTELANLIGKSERQTRQVVGELEKYSLITREKQGRKVVISLGETFFNCGYSEESFRFVRLYKTRLHEVAQKLTLSELGLLMLLTSHFHWKTHLLVDNPSEQDSNKLLIWKRKHIADEFGVSIDFIKRAIPKLRNARAIYEVKSAKNGIVLDPSLICKDKVKPRIEEILDTINECEFKKENIKK
ncbi:hypothetical protein [Alteribacillus sp. HJP-4]|uniref:hypothetical protein n=1 Tax=Alteribacillus sp. HJP-4 TaxID=2775394 RepID=UPI0035CCD65F